MHDADTGHLTGLSGANARRTQRSSRVAKHVHAQLPSRFCPCERIAATRRRRRNLPSPPILLSLRDRPAHGAAHASHPALMTGLEASSTARMPIAEQTVCGGVRTRLWRLLQSWKIAGIEKTVSSRTTRPLPPPTRGEAGLESDVSAIQTFSRRLRRRFDSLHGERRAMARAASSASSGPKHSVHSRAGQR